MKTDKKDYRKRNRFLAALKVRKPSKKRREEFMRNEFPFLLAAMIVFSIVCTFAGWQMNRRWIWRLVILPISGAVLGAVIYGWVLVGLMFRKALLGWKRDVRIGFEDTEKDTIIGKESGWLLNDEDDEEKEKSNSSKN